MSKTDTKALLSEMEELRTRLLETEETLNAIRNGEVDAIVVSGLNGDKVFSIASSETPYRIIIEAMDEGAVTVSSKGIILYCNHRFSEIVSTPLEQISGSDFSDFISLSDRAQFRKLLSTSLKHPVRDEVSVFSTGGETIHMQLSMVALPDQIEGDVCIIVTDITEIHKYQSHLQLLVEERTSKLKIANWKLHDDITKIKKAEKDLLLSDERYSLAVDAAKIGTWDHVFTTKGLKMIWSDQMLNLFNFPPGTKITPEIVTGRVHSDDRNLLTDNLLDPKDKSTIHTWENRVIWPDNTMHWIHITGQSTHHDAVGNVLRMNGVAFDITDRKKSETEIRVSEERYKLLSDTMLQGVVYFGVDGKIFRVNPAFCQLIGYEENDLLEKNIKQLFHPDEIEIIIKELDKLMKKDISSLKQERKFIRKDRKIIYVNINVAYVKNTDDIGEYFVTHIEDISKRKRAEKKLKESKEKFKLLANTIPQLAWIARADGYINWYNQRWYEYTGTTQKQMEGWGWQQLQHPKYLSGVVKRWKASIATGESFEMVFPILGKDGIYRDFLTKSTPLKDNNGKVEQWFGTNTDISELKKIEKELESSREKLSIALENGNIGTWEWNLLTNELIWDERTEKMFFIQPGPTDRSYSAFENYLYEEDISHFKDAIAHTLATGEPLETVFRTRTVDGNSNYISAKAILNKDDFGNNINMAGVFFDVTSMKKGTEQVLIKLNEELLRSNRDLQQFAYVASHDLQEPLRMVSSFTQMLLLRYEDKLDDDGKEFISYAVDGCKRMYDLLNALLAYSRVQTKGKEFVKVDLENVFEKVLQNLSLKITERNAVINKNDLPALYADENQMIQLIQNLIDNGIKFSAGSPKISISSRSENDEYIISVSDEGVGISEEYYERVFKIFQRLVTRQEYEGTGIGLAICKRIVERHGGKIWIESKPGKGSTFHFSIPKYFY